MLIQATLIMLDAILYGITMKIADLLNEHGLKWFKGSAIVFGVLWGLAGSMLVLGDSTVANIVLAMNIAFIVRNRLDYANHRIAASMIIITFLLAQSAMPYVFLAFFLVFLVFGSLKDYGDDVLKIRKRWFYVLNEAMLYYPIPTLVYCIFYGNWVVFYVFLVYTASYDIVKLVARKQGYK